ncbi:MAG: hypothetical protein GIW97_05290 [Candidatus Eremiobacteraeota bacterium]|nr:hypothetical protein [Candidatus Eremiobacteraeota bacterium]
MRKSIAAIALLATTIVAPLAAKADVDASLIPDGTYTVKVEKIVDAQHMTVVMQNAVKTTVTANRSTMDFTKLSPNDNVKMSLGKGKVLVFVKQ